MISRRLKIIFLFTLFTLGVFISHPQAKEIVSNQAPSTEVVFQTTLGTFTLQLNPEKAPKTVANFLVYVDEGFYSNTLFHRIIPRFVVQAGGFEKGLKKKQTHAPVINESENGLQNIRGTISMARSNNPDSATSQFFINLAHNPTLDQHDTTAGYTVFGKITEGMEVIDNIVKLPTTTQGRYQDVPKEDVVILSAKRKGSTITQSSEKKAKAAEQKKQPFIAGEHFIVLDKPVTTRDSSKVEVVEMFSYGCPHCLEFEPLIKEWAKQQNSDIDFWDFPAVWNKPMKLFAKAFYTAQELNLTEKIHLPLFSAIVIEQKSLRSQSDLADFFATHGVDKKTFIQTFKSTAVENQAKQAEARTKGYKPVGVPEIIVNGKYRVDRMRAGGMAEMLAVADFLINKERTLLKK